MRQYREARAVLHTAMSDRRVPRVCPACAPRVPACSGVFLRGDAWAPIPWRLRALPACQYERRPLLEPLDVPHTRQRVVFPACSRVFPRVPACSGVGSVAGPSAHELRPPSNHRGHLLGVFIIGAPERPVSRL